MKNAGQGGAGFAAALKKNRLFIIMIAALLSAALTVGGVFGIVAAVRESRALVSFEGVRAELGVVNYLASTRKNYCMRILSARSGITAADTPEFWANTDTDGRSFAEYLDEEVEAYVRRVVIGTYIFDRAGELTDSERSNIDTLTGDILGREADGDEKRFNELAAPMGFDYDDFCLGTEMVYKYNSVATRIYGSDGSGLTTDELNEYFDLYSHVQLLFIRTERDFVIDEWGNYVYSEGSILQYELSETEVAERVADIEYIRTLIANYESKTGEMMTPGVMTTFLDKYDYNDPYADTGYYMSANSSFVIDSIEAGHPDFVEASANIAAAALGMRIGEYREVECPFGTVFIYKYENEPYAYADSELEVFFSDFTADAVSYHCRRKIDLLSAAVTVKDGFYEIDLVALPYNKSIYAI